MTERNNIIIIIDYPEGAIKPFILGSSRLGSIKQGGDGHVFSAHGDTSLSSILYDRSQIKSTSIRINNTNNNGQVFNGVAAGNGSVQLVDTDEKILGFAQNDFLNAGLPVREYLNPPSRLNNETLVDYENRIHWHMVGNLRTERFNYSYGNANVSVDLQDDILSWNSTSFSGTGRNNNNTAFTFFESLKTVTPHTINASDEIIDYFKSATIPTGYIAPGNLMTAWNTFLDATSTKMYKNRFGEIWIIM